MRMKTQRLLNIAMILLSCASLPFLGVRNIKRFFPASILVFLICCLDVQIGKRRRWWSFYNKPQAFIPNEFPFLIGPFLAGAMWVLKWTYGNFSKFIMVNAAMEALFAVPVTQLYKKLKVYRLVRMNAFQFFLFFFYKAFFLYGFQYFFESKKKLTQSNNVDR